MEFGVHLPHVGPFATPEAIVGVAQKAEELGYHSLWVSDHIITPRNLDASSYPGGRYPVQPEWPFLEPVSTLMFAAAVTRRVRLGTSVLVITQRQPVVLAKQLATLDVLSGGRLIFGAGAGWLKEEFEALNVPIVDHGPRMAEYLEVIRRCWTEDDPSFDGRYYKLADVGFYPKPVQKPHPPIWIGGAADGALRRVARYGDAWHANGPPQMLAEGYAKVKRYAEEYGRDPDSIALTVRGDAIGWGDPAQAIDQVRAYKEIGVSLMVMIFVAPSADAAGDLMARFMRDVAGKV
jgi:probable F420-dependent oxidoreductase